MGTTVESYWVLIMEWRNKFICDQKFGISLGDKNFHCPPNNYWGDTFVNVTPEKSLRFLPTTVKNCISYCVFRHWLSIFTRLGFQRNWRRSKELKESFRSTPVWDQTDQSEGHWVRFHLMLSSGGTKNKMSPHMEPKKFPFWGDKKSIFCKGCHGGTTQYFVPPWFRSHINLFRQPRVPKFL